jgi:Holliday junction resolvasome RuvABC endonuclease subunit
MQFAVKQQLGLKAVPEPADVADALAIALTYWSSVLAVPAMATASLQVSAADLPRIEQI